MPRSSPLGFKFKNTKSKDAILAIVTIHGNAPDTRIWTDSKLGGPHSYATLETQFDESDVDNLIMQLKKVKEVFFTPQDKELKFDIGPYHPAYDRT